MVDRIISRFEGLLPPAVEAINEAEHFFGSNDPDLISSLTQRKLSKASAIYPDLANLFLALSRGLVDDWAAAREGLHQYLNVSIEPPFPWGLMSAILIGDDECPDVLLDWAFRLASRRSADTEVQSWVAITLARAGERRLAIEIAERTPDPGSANWILLLVPAASNTSRHDLVSSWLHAWSASTLEPLGGGGREDVVVLRTAVAHLRREHAGQLGRSLLSRLPPEPVLAEEVREWMFDLVEIAQDSTLALDVLMACAAENDPTSASLSGVRAAVALQAKRIRPIFAALLYQEVWRRFGALEEGFGAVNRWNNAGAYDADFALDLLVSILRTATSDGIASLTDQVRQFAGSVVHDTLRGSYDMAQIADVLQMCQQLGLSLPTEHSARWFLDQWPNAVERDIEVRTEITRHLRAGRGDLGHRLAVSATFTEMVGPAPAGLLVDALIEGGAHGEAFQLSNELMRRYPNDAVSGLKLAAALVWHGRTGAARELTREALLKPWRTTAGASVLFQWASNLDINAARAACEAALRSARFRSEFDSIRALLQSLNDSSAVEPSDE